MKHLEPDTTVLIALNGGLLTGIAFVVDQARARRGLPPIAPYVVALPLLVMMLPLIATRGLSRSETADRLGYLATHLAVLLLVGGLGMGLAVWWSP